MKTRYSKPLGDIALETADETARAQELLASQVASAQRMASQPTRTSCLLCEATLVGSARFRHRVLEFFSCKACSHIQSCQIPPAGYPNDVPGGATFQEVYPRLTDEEAKSRRMRVYEPKLQWALDAKPELKKARWLEIGSGAGYFLETLKGAGISQFKGIEQNAELAQHSQKRLGKDHVIHHSGSAAQAVAVQTADVIAAFFVLEHLEDAFQFFKALSAKPKGTAFVFAVPVFGFATILESAMPHISARCLEEMFHVQLYTERSLQEALKRAGYRVEAEWIFGQDAGDLSRVLLQTARTHQYPPAMIEALQAQLGTILDPLQSLLDQNRFSDARHVLAVKE